jgi:flagellar biosynthesis protein FlhB
LAGSAQQELGQLNLEKVNFVVMDPTTEQAVVLEYDPDTMESPIVVEQRDDFNIQEEYGILIVESTLLTQALFDQCDVGQAVPDNLLYPDVAEMLAEVYILTAITDRINDELEKQFDSQRSDYARTRRRHSRSPIRISLD